MVLIWGKRLIGEGWAGAKDIFAGRRFACAYAGCFHVNERVCWTRYYSKVNKNCVHIEENPRIMDELKQNVEPFGHMCIQALLWNVAGEERDFFLTDSNGNESQVSLTHAMSARTFCDCVWGL